jgi:hypothetical protein
MDSDEYGAASTIATCALISKIILSAVLLERLRWIALTWAPLQSMNAFHVLPPFIDGVISSISSSPLKL